LFIIIIIITRAGKAKPWWIKNYKSRLYAKYIIIFVIIIIIIIIIVVVVVVVLLLFLLELTLFYACYYYYICSDFPVQKWDENKQPVNTNKNRLQSMQRLVQFPKEKLVLFNYWLQR